MERREQIILWLKTVLAKHLSVLPYKAFIFGSQANLAVLKRADIDIGIIADQRIPVQKMAAIYKDIESLPMLYNVDIVDFFDVNASFVAVAMRNTESL